MLEDVCDVDIRFLLLGFIEKNPTNINQELFVRAASQECLPLYIPAFPFNDFRKRGSKGVGQEVSRSIASRCPSTVFAVEYSHITFSAAGFPFYCNL